MKGTQVNIAPITCKLFNLAIFTTDPNVDCSEMILSQDESFSLRVTVEFGGPGAIAMMPLNMTINVMFFAEPYGIGSKVELGSTSVNTYAGILMYSPTLAIAKPAAVGLSPEEIYQVIGVLRVGAPDWPALITGFIDGLALQTYP
mgnify:CR=1 FL=1